MHFYLPSLGSFVLQKSLLSCDILILELAGQPENMYSLLKFSVCACHVLGLMTWTVDINTVWVTEEWTVHTETMKTIYTLRLRSNALLINFFHIGLLNHLSLSYGYNELIRVKEYSIKEF